MLTKLVVAAVLVIAAVAVADAARRGPDEPETTAPTTLTAPAEPDVTRVVRGASGPYSAAAGGFVESSVLLRDEPHLSGEQIAGAFPAIVRDGDLFDIRDLAVAPDGTLVIAVYQFPTGQPARAAIELWRGTELVTAFGVLPGAFAGGLGFSSDGDLIAGYSADGSEVILFDRTGRFVARRES